MKVVIATGNRGKLAELQAMLAPLAIDAVPQSDFDVPEAEETGLSFVENALIKARNAARHTGMAAIADDSGLEVDALNGAPGIHSARYADRHGDDAANNRKLLDALADVPPEQWTARFQCVAVFMRHAEDPVPLIAQGTWEGYVIDEPRGDNGFGYDPLFFVPELACTSAQLPPETKNVLSHRGLALATLCAMLEQSAR